MTTTEPWLPENLPSGWEVMQMRRIATFRNGADYKEVEVTEGGYPVYGSGGEFRRAAQYLYDGESVLFGRKGTIDKPLLVSGRFWTVDTMFFTELTSDIEPRFLHYYATTMPFDYYSTSTALPSMTQGELGGHRMPLPPVAEQRAIADFLDRETARIDTLIEEQQRLIELLRNRKTAILNEVTSTALGEPVRLKYLFTPSTEANHPAEEVLSVYRDYGVIPKSSRDDNFNRTPENVERYLLVRPGDVVINRMKAWQGSLGVSGYRGIVSGDYEVVRPTNDHLLPRFTHLFLRSPKMIAEYAVRSTGIRPSQWRLYWDQMGNIELPVPPHPQQIAIVERIDDQVAKIDTLIDETERFIKLARERRAAVITAAVTGRIDVREVASRGAAQ